MDVCRDTAYTLQDVKSKCGTWGLLGLTRHGWTPERTWHLVGHPNCLGSRKAGSGGLRTAAKLAGSLSSFGRQGSTVVGVLN